MFGRATITLGIGPHSSLFLVFSARLSWLAVSCSAHVEYFLLYHVIVAKRKSIWPLKTCAMYPLVFCSGTGGRLKP